MKTTTGPTAILDPIFGSEDRRWGGDSSIFGPEERRPPIFDFRSRRSKNPPIFNLRSSEPKLEELPPIFDLGPRRMGRRSDGRGGGGEWDFFSPRLKSERVSSLAGGGTSSSEERRAPPPSSTFSAEERRTCCDFVVI